MQCCVWMPMHHVRKCISKCDVLSAGVVCKKHEVNQFQNMQVTHQFPSTPWVPGKELESDFADCRTLCILHIFIQSKLTLCRICPYRLEFLASDAVCLERVSIHSVRCQMTNWILHQQFEHNHWPHHALVDSCWHLFHNPENHKTHITGSKAKQCNVGWGPWILLKIFPLVVLGFSLWSSKIIFRYASISSTYPAEWMGWSVGQSLELSYLWGLQACWNIKVGMRLAWA